MKLIRGALDALEIVAKRSPLLFTTLGSCGHTGFRGCSPEIPRLAFWEVGGLSQRSGGTGVPKLLLNEQEQRAVIICRSKGPR